MPGKILVADDSANIREVLQMNLETLGYEVVLAADGDQALKQIYQERPDLLILDVMMPKQNGFQICRKVKADPQHGRTSSSSSRPRASGRTSTGGRTAAPTNT